MLALLLHASSVVDRLTCTPGFAEDDDGDGIGHRYAWELDGLVTADFGPERDAPASGKASPQSIGDRVRAREARRLRVRQQTRPRGGDSAEAVPAGADGSPTKE